ncbi:MAG: acetylesterase [Solobacterium sp.]|nr:acetylesterase [Solobacterium sp.]
MATIQLDLYSRCLQRNVPVTVIIPADTVEFESQPLPPEEPYPAFYLLHGFFGNQNDWVFKGLLQQLAVKYRVAFILPSGENHFYLDMPSGEHYSRYIGEELVEQTRRLFPLSRRREDTIIGGLSMGGFGSLLNGFRWNENFGWIVSLSPAIFSTAMLKERTGPEAMKSGNFTAADSFPLRKDFLLAAFGPFDEVDGSDKDIFAMYRQAVASACGSPQIYLACGTEDRLYPKVALFRDFLQKEGAPLTFKDGPGIHDWLFWNTYLEDALETFLPLKK